MQRTRRHSRKKKFARRLFVKKILLFVLFTILIFSTGYIIYNIRLSKSESVNKLYKTENKKPTSEKPSLNNTEPKKEKIRTSLLLSSAGVDLQYKLTPFLH